MADTRLYKVAITPCGKYVHGTEYDMLSLVLNSTDDGGDGCAYVSLRRNKNVRPGTDSSVWALTLEKGEQGEQGIPGSGFSNIEVTVDDTSGTPSASNRIENDTLYLDFSGLKGAKGNDGQNGADGINGSPGADGKSAYQVWRDAGNIGTPEDFLASLKGEDGSGQSAYELAVEQGYEGSPIEWINSLHGDDGVGFQSVSSNQDGTVNIQLTSGDTITIDLNHNHVQYLKYVYLNSESAMPVYPDNDTLYLIRETNNG